MNCLLPRVREYLDDERMSCRQAVRHEGQVIGYGLQLPEPSPEPARELLDPSEESSDSTPKEDNRALNHSTLWRLAAWVGLQSPALREAIELILARDPLSDCHRIPADVSPKKFRGPQRQQVLGQARRLLKVMRIWEDLFSTKFFPRFATKSGFD